MTTQKTNTSKAVEIGIVLYTIIYFFFLIKDSIFGEETFSFAEIINKNMYIILTLVSVGIAYSVVKKAIENNMFEKVLSNKHAITMGTIFIAVTAWFVFIL